MNILIRNQQKGKRVDLKRIKRDLRKALSLTGFPEAELSILFVGNRKMRRLNSLYRGVDAVTDVLSFPMADRPQKGGSPVLGDIVICIPRITEQSKEYRVSFRQELRRMLVHGLLHLLGYDHEKGMRQRTRMEKKEEEILNALAEMD